MSGSAPVRPVGLAGALAAGERERAETRGAGPLQVLLDDPEVTDVLVNGAAGVWVDRGAGLARAEVPPLTGDAVRRLATRLAATAGQRLDDAAPVADGRLPDGTRLHAVLPPVSADGALISLRTMRRRPMTMSQLEEAGTVGPQGAGLLRALVDCRANVLISGATGAGKTTLLAALLSLAPHDERILCIEEALELAPEHPHVVHLQVRRANVQGAGRVALEDLVRAAMRMRPDRLVLGECRGPEVREVLGALNTGHDGGWATVHANAATDVPARLTALGALAGMAAATVAAQAVSALDAIVHLRRDGACRRLAEVAVLEVDGAGRLLSRLAATADARGDLVAGPAWDVLARRLEAGAAR
jgi:pilus assembly protein CpaF